MILDIYIGYTYIYIYAVIEPVNIESQLSKAYICGETAQSFLGSSNTPIILVPIQE